MMHGQKNIKFKNDFGIYYFFFALSQFTVQLTVQKEIWVFRWSGRINFCFL